MMIRLVLHLPDPALTDNNDPILSALISASFRIVVVKLGILLATLFASFAKKLGVQMLAGVFPNGRAKFIPLPTALPNKSPFSAAIV